MGNLHRLLKLSCTRRDHLVGHARWFVTAHHQLDDAGAQTHATLSRRCGGCGPDDPGAGTFGDELAWRPLALRVRVRPTGVGGRMEVGAPQLRWCGRRCLRPTNTAATLLRHVRRPCGRRRDLGDRGRRKGAQSDLRRRHSTLRRSPFSSPVRQKARASSLRGSFVYGGSVNRGKRQPSPEFVVTAANPCRARSQS